MKVRSRIRFNPVTKDIEIEGSEEFVKVYFNKIQEMISDSSSEIVEDPRIEKVRPAEKAKKDLKAVKAHPPKKSRKAKKREPGVKKVTNVDAVVTLIQGSIEGISTAELKEKTGLTEHQIWNIVNRASKEGRIRKMKRGLYAG
jgi:hypothetical protein